MKDLIILWIFMVLSLAVGIALAFVGIVQLFKIMF